MKTADKMKYFLAGFQMANKIVKAWVPTGRRAGDLLMDLAAREAAIKAEARRAGR